MSTNRRREAEAVRLGTMLRAVAACGVIACLGIGYVRQNAQQLELGRQITELERRRERLDQTLAIQRLTLSTLTSRPELLARVRRFNLGLTNAAPGQRLYVTLPAPTGVLAVPSTGRSVLTGRFGGALIPALTTGR